MPGVKHSPTHTWLSLPLFSWFWVFTDTQTCTYTHTMYILHRAFRSDSHVRVCLRRWFTCITSDVKHCNYEVSHFILHSQTTNKPLFYMRQLGSGNRREDTPTPLSNPSSGHSHFSLSVLFLSLPIPGGERGISCPSPARSYCQLISQRPSGVPVGTGTTIPRIPWGKLFHRGSMIAQDDTQEIYKVGSAYTHKPVGGLEFVLCAPLTGTNLHVGPVAFSCFCCMIQNSVCFLNIWFAKTRFNNCQRVFWWVSERHGEVWYRSTWYHHTWLSFSFK